MNSSSQNGSENAGKGSTAKGRRSLTLLLVADEGWRGMRRLRLSHGTLALAALSLAVVLGSAVVAPGLWLILRSRSASVERLEEENRVLRGETERFEETLAAVSGRLDRFEAHAVRLARELGIEDPSTASPAAGGGGSLPGATPEPWFEGELNGLDARTRALDSVIEEIDDAFRDRVRMLASTPSALPVEGWFSHGYGWRKDPFSGKREFHRGIDIVAPANTEIVAPADGVVSRSGRYSDYGRSIDIAHGYGYVTRYAHMNKVLVRPGERVRRGDVIGLVGSTGRSTGPHLHYEVFRDGRRVNPWKYLGQR